MKKLLLTFSLCLLATIVSAQKPAITKDTAIEEKIENILSKMTLDDKVGQMLELNFDHFGKYDKSTGKWILNEVMLDTIISKYRIGSILNAPNTQAWSVEQWQEWIGLIQKKSMEYLDIPCIYGLDQNHGVTYVQGGTLFPQPINLGASFNISLAENMARVTAYESRAANCPWVYNPVLDLGRDPRWPRIWESFGEDAIVNARMVEAEILGYQGADANHLSNHNVAACVKHYLAYGAPWSGKDRTPAYLAPNMLREKYFEPYKAAIQAGALSVMVNSSSINGVPVHASWEYLTKWLKEDLQWDGMIVTDWADINNLYQREHVAKDRKDAIRIAINAGIDMSMDPYNPDFCILLKQLVNEGKVSMKRIDDAVKRILRIKFRLGLFDVPNSGEKGFEDYGCDEFAQLSLHAAEETEVLLKNENNILPIAKGTRILVAGPNANQMRCLNGGWSYSWQGNRTDDFAQKYNTIYEALSNKFGQDNVVLCQGVTYNEKGTYYEENTPEIEKAVDAAKDVDIIVACIGENSYCETVGNLSDLWLSENQRNLVKALSATGKPIILILNEGRPRLIADIVPIAHAIIDILLPGNYGADALANLLSGDVNFSAKLPYTYPREINSLATYDYKVSEEMPTMEGDYNYDAKVSLQWPFGYGMSYTSFEYSNLSVSQKEFSSDDCLTVSVDVTNTGSLAGKEAVLLYSSDLVASIVPDNKRLRCFQKIDLQPGETRTVTFSLPAKNLAFVGADNKWTIEEGDFLLKVGNLSQKIYCKETKVWDEPNI
ncbi:MAG: glycoside hydrolase family 3 C-terminal domain-containing protein [Prevotella sp.]|nr:glycoside hydrolase family 3 C-terminal domain-containing protein [Prevotella sp.]